jgi:wyosine [tRNA(Phe)-imidazoG37] synthetase (radical SAM superfamily)
LCFTGDYETTRETTKDDPQGTKKVAQTILVYSHTASMEELREFINYLAKLEKKKANMMTVYRVVSSTKDANPDWDCLKFHSNKTENNTIVSAKVKSELFDDIDLFMNSENLYAERGLDYKRGYMLYGLRVGSFVATLR